MQCLPPGQVVAAASPGGPGHQQLLLAPDTGPRVLGSVGVAENEARLDRDKCSRTFRQLTWQGNAWHLRVIGAAEGCVFPNDCLIDATELV